MHLLIFLLLGLSLAYGLLLAIIAYGWAQLPNRSTDAEDYPYLSVLVPARNEVSHLPTLLDSLRQQDYPTDRYEVLLLDDHSTDASQAVVGPYCSAQIRLLSLEGEQQGKKQALALGIAQSRGEYLFTTDADCELSSNWLSTLSGQLQQGADMVLAPVRIKGADNLLTAFQGLDVAGTMLLTGAAVHWGCPVLANGANLGFRRNLLDQLGGYSPQPDRSSGDDVFLLHAAVRARARVAYCKSPSAVVDTAAVTSWLALLRQRLRWAGKTSSYRHWGLLAFQGFVFGLSWGLILGPALLPEYWYWWLWCWGIKITSDSIFLGYACRAVGQPPWIRWVLPGSILHTVYVAVVGILAVLPITVQWKGRDVS